MGALPDPDANPDLPPDQQSGNKTWQLFNYGFGPYNDGIFTQSSLGECDATSQLYMPAAKLENRCCRQDGHLANGQPRRIPVLLDHLPSR
jgi:hypothetical protein